jgi:hypothetical protein
LFWWDYRNKGHNSENFPGLSPGEDGLYSYNSETKHDRKTTSRPKLFVSARRLQEQRLQLQKLYCIWVAVKIVSVARQLSTIEKRLQNRSCFYRRGDYRNRDHNHENLSCVQVPVKMVSVTRKVSTTEEQCKDRSCLFRWGDYRNKGHNPENSVLGSSSGEDVFCSSESTHDRTAPPTPKLFVSAGRLRERRPQFWKAVMGSNPDDDGFCSSETEHGRRTASRSVVCISEEITGTKITKHCPGFESRWHCSCSSET